MAFAPLLRSNHRIKFYYGGRCGGKSFAFADSLLILGRKKKLFITCLREIQDSIKDSVYKLLVDRINYYALSDYKIFEDRIDNVITGTRFVFKGLRDQDSQKIKSLEGVDIAWIEEAQTITKKSWDILEPTIRKDGSEIWVSMNRLFENDPMWVSVAAKPDDRTLVKCVNYYDNPFCPEEMKYLAEKCKREDPRGYLHIWEGLPQQQGDLKLISATDVKRAFEPKMDNSTSPLIIGLDVARFGDDSTTFCFRRGRWCYKFETIRKFDNVEVANFATNYINTYHPHRMFIDVGGQGAGVFDILNSRGFGEIIRAINFGEKAIKPERYVNKRAEMWDNIRDWLSNDKLPVQMPDSNDLFEELITIEKRYDGRGRLQLEGKDDLKQRLGRSPDKADALALTFAEPVYDTGVPRLYGNGNVPVEQLFKDANRGSKNSW